MNGARVRACKRWFKGAGESLLMENSTQARGEEFPVGSPLTETRLLVFFSVIPRFLSRVAGQLQACHPGMQLHGVALGRTHERLAEASGGNWESISLFSDAMRKHGLDRPADIGFLREMEVAYGRPNLYLMAQADWYARNYPAGKMLRFLEIVFRFSLQVFDRVRPDAVIAEGIDCALTHALYSIASAAGVPYVFPASGRLPGRVALIGNPNDRWERTEQLFSEFSRSGMPDHLRKTAEGYLEQYLNGGPAPSQLKVTDRCRLLRAGDLQLWREVVRTHREDPEDYTAMPPRQVIAQRLERAMRARLVARYYREPEPGERYVIFPLHVQPEATTMTLAPHYVDQPALVVNIAKSLPVGFFVYVKEHPYAVGLRKLEEYRRISEIPNAKLVPTRTSARELLRKASAITTIAGTMGLEGLMSGLPVITFGRPFYAASGLTYQVEKPSELPALMQAAFFGHRHDRERLIAFLAAAIAGSYPGQIAYERVSPPEATSEENIALVAKAFEKELSDRLLRPHRPAAQQPELDRQRATCRAEHKLRLPNLVVSKVEAELVPGEAKGARTTGGTRSAAEFIPPGAGASEAGPSGFEQQAPAREPLVSVVVTAFNLKRYVSQSIESILVQPYSTIEVIVVDDGSTDGTAEVLDQFQSEPRVRVIRQENGGSAVARNAGARLARGEFLAFLDGDDIATSRRIIAPVEALERDPDAALAYGRIDLVNEAGELIVTRKNPSRYRSGWVAKDLLYRNFIPFSTITLRRDVFGALGGFDETIRSSEDWELLLRLATRHRVVFVNECLACYRVRSGSKTMDVEAKERAIRAVQERVFGGAHPRRNGRSLPRLAEACRWMGLSGTLIKQGETRRALRFFSRALRCHPGVLFVYRSEIWDGLCRLAGPKQSQMSRQEPCT